MSDTPTPPEDQNEPAPDDAAPVTPDPGEQMLAVQPVALQDEMERSFIDYGTSVIRCRGSARRGRWSG